MSLLINLKQVEERDLELEGEIPVIDLDLGREDEVVHFSKPLKYQLVVQSLQDGLLVSGRLELPVECECVRCLKPFSVPLELANWACHIPLVGEDRPPVVRDSVDLTPYIREDIVLALPVHPVCRIDCPGLPAETSKALRRWSQGGGKCASPWDELNKLKLKS